MLEVGSSNIFFVFSNGHDVEVVTPALEDMVLPGVTRDSVIVSYCLNKANPQKRNRCYLYRA